MKNTSKKSWTSVQKGTGLGATVLDQMAEIVAKYVKHYQTDFTDYDVDTYKKADDGAQFVWLVRTCGTYFHLLPKQLNEKPVYEKEVLELYPRLKDQTLESFRKERSESIKFELDYFQKNKSPRFDVHYFLVTKGVGVEKISYKKALEAVEV